MKNSLMSLAVISLLAFTGCGDDASSIEPADANTHETTANENSESSEHAVSDEVIAEQRAVLAASLKGDEGAQSPRDIDAITGNNSKESVTADPFTLMNLCDIHFHKSAEHKGGEFTEYAGNGNGEGYGSGYKYSKSDTLTQAELASYEFKEQYEHNPLHSGDTIEAHYVYSSSPDATLGNGLGTCLNADGTAPSLRVESEVYVLVNDESAPDFNELNTITTEVNGFHQAANIPDAEGATSVNYEGSTTGPGYNEEVSPYQVSWSVRTHVTKLDIATVEEWLEHNDFNETHAHAVRNLVINPDLLSEIH